LIVPKKRAKKTNITAEHQRHFKALMSGKYSNFALFSCFVNGEPSAAIVVMEDEGEGSNIHPIFVAVTEGMRLEDHEWMMPGIHGGGRWPG
jgi:hypothetical protein